MIAIFLSEPANELYQNFCLPVLLYWFFNPIVYPPAQLRSWRCPLCTRLGPLWAALPMSIPVLFSHSVSSPLRAGEHFSLRLALSFSHFLLSGEARSGGRSFFSAPALLFFSIFARGRRKCASRKAPTQKQTQTQFFGSAKMVEFGRFQLRNSFFFSRRTPHKHKLQNTSL